MNNNTVSKTANINNKSGYNKVNKSILNTQCIICKTEFLKPRSGKLYCSNRCKQFGYNHKDLKNEKLTEPIQIKKNRVKKILIEDYFFFQQLNLKIKRFKDLAKRNQRFEEEETKINIRNSLGLLQNPETIVSHNSLELNDTEIEELESLSDEIKGLINFEAHNLSLEQWSFFKLLYPQFDNENLFRTISQFSKDYINQLNFASISDETADNLTIKNKFIEHCNQITERIIRFVESK